MTRTVIITDTDGCLTDGTVYVDSDGRESLRFCKRDGWLLREAAEAGIEVVVVTMDPNPAPSRERAIKMGCQHVAVTSAEGKRDLVLERKATGARVVYIGDSPQDLLAMQAADEAWAPRDHGLPRIGRWRIGGVEECNVAMADGGQGVLHWVLGRLLEGAT